MKKLLAAFIIVFSFSSFLYANQEERIIRFDVVMTLSKDNTAVIEENFLVYAKGEKIRRGLYRDIPKSFRFGIFEGIMNFSDISLERNGHEEPFFIENPSQGIRINFGNDSFLERGTHYYKLKYKADNIVGFYDDYDEVYWNVTGNNWEFIIDNATFRLVLPDGIEVFRENISSYLGKIGEKDKHAYEISFLFFDSRMPLMPGEGMTVAVPFKKGFITEPPLIEIISSNIYIFFPLIAVMIIMIAYYIIKRENSRKYNKNTYQHFFEPPKEFDAAFINYFWNMGTHTDDQLASIYISELLMNGSASIKEEKAERYILIPNPDMFEKLSDREQKIYKQIFPNNETLKLYEYNPNLYAFINSEHNRFVKESQKYYKLDLKNYFITLSVFFIFLVICGFINTDLSSIRVLISSLIFLVFFAICIYAGEVIIRIFKSGLVGSAVMIGFFFVFFTGLMSLLSVFSIHSGSLSDFYFFNYMISVNILVIVTAWFNASVLNLTEEGIELYNKIKGYRDFLLSRQNTVDNLSINDAFGEFSKHMPYAMALGISNKWAKIFERQLGYAYNNGIMKDSGVDNFMRNGHFRSKSFFSKISPNLSSSSSGIRVFSGGSGSGGGGSSGGGRGGGGGR